MVINTMFLPLELIKIWYKLFNRVTDYGARVLDILSDHGYIEEIFIHVMFGWTS